METLMILWFSSGVIGSALTFLWFIKKFKSITLADLFMFLFILPIIGPISMPILLIIAGGEIIIWRKK